MILKGWRLDVEVERTVTVSGTLRVIRHAAGAVNGAIVPAWAKIRVEE